MSVEEARRKLELESRALRRPRVAQVEDRYVDCPLGRRKVRIYRSGNDVRPVVMYFHGGGFVLGSIDTHDNLAREICARTASTVVSVEYSLAPENRFPAAPDDCLAVTQWVAAHAGELGGDAARMALAGDSAGGNLAAVTALRLRDEGGSIPVSALLLLYPVTDHYSAGFPSYSEFNAPPGLTGDKMRWFWDNYLNDPSEADHPFASPNRADYLRGMPPSFVITAGLDPLRDEGEAFARRLIDAGVDARCIRYAKMSHGFAKWSNRIAGAEKALDEACTWLRDTLRQSGV